MTIIKQSVTNYSQKWNYEIPFNGTCYPGPGALPDYNQLSGDEVARRASPGTLPVTPCFGWFRAQHLTHQRALVSLLEDTVEG
jgi:hypothetical protein